MKVFSKAVRIGFDPRYPKADLFPFSGAETAAHRRPSSPHCSVSWQKQPVCVVSTATGC